MEKIKYYALAILAVFLIATGQAAAKPLQYGHGGINVILFTDFFCGPCQVMESEIEETLNYLVTNNIIRITLVPVPMSSKSMATIVHFVSEVADQPYSTMQNERHTLYGLARRGKITERLIRDWVAQYQQKTNIKPYIQAMSDLTKKYKVNSTPTCVIEYPDGTAKVYKGSGNIAYVIKSFMDNH